MFLISLALAAATPPAVRPAIAQRRAAPRPRPAAAAPTRSKRLIELEATVRALTPADDQQGRGGPEGL
jgi:hypothetical protein